MGDPAMYERFDCAPGLKLEAHERLTALHQENLAKRMDRLDEMMERMERRLWLTVYGVVAVILTQAVQSVMAVAP
ncbi:MAG: hypothetical protein WA782_12060 [Sulfitobacter sp.]